MRSYSLIESITTYSTSKHAHDQRMEEERQRRKTQEQIEKMRLKTILKKEEDKNDKSA